MPSHKEILQARNDETSRAFAEVAAEADRLHGLITAEKNAIAQLTADHANACRTLATGGDADSGAILAEKARRGDRLTGLEVLYGEVSEKVTHHNAEHVQAGEALRAELEREELLEMDAAIKAANQKVLDAREALKQADAAEHAAIWKRDRYRHQIELRNKAKA